LRRLIRGGYKDSLILTCLVGVHRRSLNHSHGRARIRHRLCWGSVEFLIGIPVTTDENVPGGTVACVIAGRLLTADPSLKILVVESGHHSRDRQYHYQPCRFLENLAPTSTTVTFNAGKPSPLLNGRPLIVPCGRALGGGSTVNCKPMLPYITKYY